MAARKTIVGCDGPLEWVPGRQVSDFCVKMPLAIDGGQAGHVFCAVFVPAKQVYALNIIWRGKCITRLDWDPLGRHTNGLDAPYGAGLPIAVSGTHLHRWSHNVRFFESDAALLELKYAEELPDSIKTFEHSLRYFCDEANIDLPNGHYIELPQLLL